MNKVTLCTKNFDAEAIFTCGQCFRWEKEEDGSFTTVAKGKVINVLQKGNSVTFSNTTEQEFKEIWEDYFDLKRDYGKIIEHLSKNEIIAESVKFGSGIRILKQDFFECLLSFIISANNNIPRIQKIINTLCTLWGEKISYTGKDYYTFPTAEAMRGVKEADLAPLKCGYRAKYIEKAVAQILGGEAEESEIDKMDEKSAREALMKICGVGPKVADCILLFSFGKFEVFPTDVWVKRVMGELFNCSEKDATRTGQQLFGQYAGIAQQYLFYKRREMK